MNRFQFDPIFDSWLVMLGLAVVLLGLPLGLRIYGNELNVRRRRILLGLRLAAAVLLLIAALRPALIRTDSQPGRATLAVLVDRSRSMTLPSSDGRSRWEQQGEVRESLALALRDSDESLGVKWFGYAEGIQEFSDVELSASKNDPPVGQTTDLFVALSGALRAASGEPLAGVILIGDGVHNPPKADRAQTDQAVDRSRVASPMDNDPQSVARTLGSLDVPLWTVPIGPSGDVDRIRDAQVDQLIESMIVYSGNQFQVDFVLRSQALQGFDLPIRLWISPENQPNERVELASRQHSVSKVVDAVSFSIPVSVDQPGEYRLEVEVAPQEGETLLTNNSQVAFVEVRQGGGRVLYLEGQPRPEQTFLKRALRRFPDLELTYRWVGVSGADQPPTDWGDLFAPGNFDIFVLGDLPSSALAVRDWQRLSEAVRNGSGLLAIGGLSAFDAGGFADSPLADALPVELGTAMGGRGAQIEGPISPRLTRAHPITALKPGDDSLEGQQAYWDKLPPLVGANRLGPPRTAPGVSVLLSTSDQLPLLVIGEFGDGRVAAFAGDSTWRWWRRGADDAHRRFWRQLMLWLADRGDDPESQLLIELDRRRFVSADAVRWKVTRFGAGTAFAEGRPDIEVVGPGGAVTAVVVEQSETDVNSDRQTFAGSLPKLGPGLYRLRARLGDGGVSMERSFQVLDQDRELADPFADTTYLAQLSGQTAAAGGASLLPSQVDELIARIAQLRRTAASPIVKKYRLGDDAASAWPLLLSIVGLMSTEWVLRRRWGLV